MQLITFSILIPSLLGVCLAAPANDKPLVPRQTYTITCIGDHCDDGSKPSPTPPPKPPKPTSKPQETPTKTTKTTTKPAQTTGEEIGPSSTRCPVPLYYQCGGYYDGKPWTGCTKCVKGAKCIWQNDWYYQCVAEDS